MPLKNNLDCPGYKRRHWFNSKCKHYYEMFQIYSKRWDRFCNHPTVEETRGNLCSYQCTTDGKKPKE